MSHRQFYQYCLAQQETIPPEAYEDVPYPHPYLVIWMECHKHPDSLSGTPSYPDPTRGWLEQDADLMLACDVLDDLQHERQQAEEARDKVRAAREQMFGK